MTKRIPRILLWSFLLLALSIVGAAATGPHPSLPPPVVPDCLGVNIHFTDPKPGELEMLSAAGFKWVRMDFSWGGTERKKGEYDFSAYDRLAVALEKHGIRALFILDYGNALYDGGLSPTSEEGRAAFARWAVEGVRHFAGKGYLWEMWNEPNGDFWKPKADVKQYAALARATGEALRDAKLLGPKGEAYIGPATSTIDLPFLEACFQAGLLEFWDAVSVHPYRQGMPETSEAEYRNLRLLIRKYAPKGKTIPIISGEWGYSDAWQNFTPELQGKYLPREFLTNIANDVALSIWYDWHDDGTNPKDPEHHFGIVANEYHAGRDPVYDPKPAYNAMRTLTAQLGGFRFDRTFIPETDPKTDGEQAFAGLFKSGANLRVAAWRFGKTPLTLDIPALPGAFSAMGYLGNATTLASAKGGLHFASEDTPTYLISTPANDALGILAAMPRLPLEIVARSPSLFEAPPSIKLELQGRSTLPDPMDLTFSCDLGANGAFSFVQRTYFVCSNPLKVEAYPGVKGELLCQIQNLSGEAFDGEVWLVRDKGELLLENLPVHFNAGEKDKTVKIPVAKGAQGSLKIVIAGKDGDGKPDELCLKLPVGDIRPMREGVLDSPKAFMDGDSKVESQFALEAAQPEEGAAPSGGNSLRLHYKTAAGWKFFELNASQPVIPLIDEHASPNEAASFPKRFGIWIHGDSQGCGVRMRFKDKTGQVFQPSGPKIDWKGWRYATFPMKPDEKEQFAHWGGANDGVIHYPITWESMFILDNVSRKPVEGEIYLSGPTLIY